MTPALLAAITKGYPESRVYLETNPSVDNERVAAFARAKERRRRTV